jgi:hypothetical protein
MRGISTLLLTPSSIAPINSLPLCNTANNVNTQYLKALKKYGTGKGDGGGGVYQQLHKWRE